MSKGSKQRPTNKSAFDDSFDRIFGASSVTTSEYKAEQERMNIAARAALDDMKGEPDGDVKHRPGG